VDRLAPVLEAFRRAFANRRLRKLQIAAVGSTLGTWAYAVALSVYAYHAGGDRAVGLLLFARFVLGAVTAPWFGVVADRWSRRRLMLVTDLVRAGISAAMTVVAIAGGTPYAVYVLTVLSTVLAGAYPPAQGALLPSLVDTPDELTSANLVSNTITSVGMFAGPALGGVVLAFSVPAAVFALNGALLLWSAAFVVQVPRDEPPERDEQPRLLHELTAGFATVVRTPALRAIVGLTGAQTLTSGAVLVLLVVLALRVLHSGNPAVGWLNAAIGIGSVFGAFVVAAIAARRRLAGGFALGILVSVVPIALAATVSTLAPALVLFFFIGAGTVLVDVTGVTLLQRAADNEVLGRVLAVLESVILGALAIGAVVAPALVTWLGPRGALVVTGAFLPAVLVPVWSTLRRIDAEAVIAEEPLEALRGIEMFAELPEPTLELLARGATPVSTPAEQVVVARGEAGNHFYVIASGRAAVELDDGAVRELGAGDSFGEIALLRDVPRTATVRALEPLRLYAIKRDDFLAAVTGHSPTLAVAENIVTARLPAGATPG
jgi:MFS family permease